MTKVFPTILVAGIGSPLLRDDGVGLHAVTRAQKRLQGINGLVFRHLGAGGFDLLDAMEGFDRAVLVDCNHIDGVPGEIRKTVIDGAGDVMRDIRLAECHGIDLAAVLDLGRLCGCKMPESVVVIGICGEDKHSFGTEPTVRVAGALDCVVDMILENVTIWSDFQ